MAKNKKFDRTKKSEILQSFLEFVDWEEICNL